MKIRQGFVSNSSSSSFMLGLPKNLTEKEKKDLVKDKLCVSENSPLLSIAEKIASAVLDSKLIDSEKKLLKECYCETIEELKEDYIDLYESYKKCQEKNLNFYMGRASNEDYDPGELILCQMIWITDDKDFYMFKNDIY